MANIEDLLHRFGNRVLGDTILRLGRDPVRKLARSDRLVGAALNALAQGVTPVHLVTGIAAGLHFAHPDDPVAQQVQMQLRNRGSSVCLSRRVRPGGGRTLTEMVIERLGNKKRSGEASLHLRSVPVPCAAARPATPSGRFRPLARKLQTRLFDELHPLGDTRRRLLGHDRDRLRLDRLGLRDGQRQQPVLVFSFGLVRVHRDVRCVERPLKPAVGPLLHHVIDILDGAGPAPFPYRQRVALEGDLDILRLHAGHIGRDNDLVPCDVGVQRQPKVFSLVLRGARTARSYPQNNRSIASRKVTASRNGSQRVT